MYPPRRRRLAVPFAAACATLLITMVLLPRAAYALGAWEWLNPRPTGAVLNAVAFPNASCGWAVGDGGTIVRTTDGGTTWDSQFSPTGRTLLAVCFVDTSDGWAVGASETVLCTHDSGANWAPQTPPSTGPGSAPYDLTSVCFADTQHGWAAGTLGMVLVTSDGGSHWTQQPCAGSLSSFAAIACADTSVAVAVGGSGLIVATVNGGHLWTTSQAQGGSASLHGVCMVGRTHAWAVGDGGTIRRWNGSGSWLAQSSATTMTLMSVCFSDAENGWAVGDEGAIVHTTDGGAHWTRQASGLAPVDDFGNPMNRLNGACSTGAGHAVAVGAGGMIVATSDSGAKWVALGASTDYEGQCKDVDFLDATHGWIARGDGLLKTTDGGRDWSWVEHDRPCMSVGFASAKLGWMIDMDNGIERTTDGGLHWTKQKSDTVALAHVFALDASHVWAAGDQGHVLATTDGGTHWAKQGSGTTNGLEGIAFADAEHGWAVGFGGTIVHTSDGGAHWSVQSAPSEWFTSVFAQSASHAWVTGFDGTILETTDGGSTWVPRAGVLLYGYGVTLPAYASEFFKSIAFSDPQHGAAVGSDGTILLTDDGGRTWADNWTSGQFLTHNTLNAIASRAGRLWAVGDQGVVLTYGPRAPTTTLDMDPMPVYRGWNLTPVTVSLSATGGSGTPVIHYALPGGQQQIYAQPLTFSTEGPHKIEFWSVDGSGAAEETRTETVAIDLYPPKTTDDHLARYPHDATIDLKVKDSASGVAATRWTLDGKRGTGSTVKTSVLGTHTVVYGSTDNAGNVEATHSVSFTVVKVPTRAAKLAVSGPTVVKLNHKCWFTFKVKPSEAPGKITFRVDVHTVNGGWRPQFLAWGTLHHGSYRSSWIKFLRPAIWRIVARYGGGATWKGYYAPVTATKKFYSR